MAVPDRNADGFPDLVLVHPEHGLLFAELKMPGRKPDTAQLHWLFWLQRAGQRTYLWYPADVDNMLATFDGVATSLFDEVAS